MTNKKIWFITGAGRGMGADFAKAVLGAGDALVATGRDPGRLAELIGPSADLLALRLDVTRPEEAEAAVRSAVERFGRIDVLVNNAAIFEAGFFEELTPELIDRTLAANLVGQMHVTRAVLPVMRKQRSGHVITISSTAGLASAIEFTSAYAASKFGLEGWMEALRVEVAPFGIHTTIVNPGLFRTELLSEQSTHYAEASVAEYDERRTALLAGWKATHGKQAGDPARLAQALLTIARQDPPPRRFLAGADAVATAERKIADLQADIESNRRLSTSLAFDERRHAPPGEDGPAQPGRRKAIVAGLGVAAASLLTRFATSAHAEQAGPPSSIHGHEERTPMSPNRAILERYYSALQKKDADKLRSAIEEGFAPDAVLRISDSLPYGGKHAGRNVILDMLMGFVTTAAPIIRPEQIKIERMVEEGDSIVAKAVFPWLAPGASTPIPMSAFEWFTFRDGRVSEMVVCYWDTAACLAAMQAAAAKR